jgi:hypothetical protein
MTIIKKATHIIILVNEEISTRLKNIISRVTTKAIKPPALIPTPRTYIARLDLPVMGLFQPRKTNLPRNESGNNVAIMGVRKAKIPITNSNLASYKNMFISTSSDDAWCYEILETIPVGTVYVYGFTASTEIAYHNE